MRSCLCSVLLCMVTVSRASTCAEEDGSNCQGASPRSDNQESGATIEDGPYGAGEYRGRIGEGSKLRVGQESIMAEKLGAHAYGSCIASPPTGLRWDVDWDTAARISCHNRHYAEHSGYWSGVVRQR